MLRVVLAALVAIALFGVAMPAVEDARTERAARLADAELDRVAAAATGLVDEEEVAPLDGAARRTVRLSLPERGPVTAGLAYVAVGGVPGRDVGRDTGDADVLAYRIHGGPPTVRRLPVDLRVVADGRVLADDVPLVIGDPGPEPTASGRAPSGGHRLVLRLVERDGDPTVLVGRPA